MTTQLVQLPGAASGSATLRLRGVLVADVAAVEIAIIQFLGDEKYLDPRNPDTPWTPSAYWFRPVAPRAEGGEVLLDLDYGVTYHLRANQPYKLLLQAPGAALIEERFVCPPNQRRPSSRPEGWQAPAAPRGPLQVPPRPAEVVPHDAVPPPPPPTPPPTPPPPVPPPPEPPPAPAAPPVVIAPIDVPVPPPPRRTLRWVGAGLAVLLLVGAALFLWLGAKPSLQPGPVTAELDSLEAVRRYLAGKPAADAAAAQFQRLAQAKKLLDGQFLLLRYAAEQGHVASAREVGRMYDPATYSKETSALPEPNPIEAARWLKLAAQGGDAEAQYRYAILLKRGGTDEDNAPEQAVVWMRKAAEQGHEQARKEASPP